MTRAAFDTPAASTAREPLTARAARRFLFRALERMNEGELTIHDHTGVHRFGPANGPTAHIRIHDPRAYTAIALAGSLGAGEAYTDALWHTDDVADVVALFIRNRPALESVDQLWSTLARPIQRVAYALQSNTRAGSRRNIAAHYDLSNEFFALWLDPTMTYSSALFTHPGQPLEDAQREKLDRLCRNARLSPDDHVLEIGTGWGSLAIHAAANYRCRVTTTTISRRQAELARERIAHANLTDRVTVLQQDYRDLTGRFDKLLSCEMIEAVGRPYLDTFIRRCADLLHPHGIMSLQGITIADQWDRRAARRRDWLKKYIFPGSCLLSVSALAAATARTDLTIRALHDIGPHYATTLRAWRNRFLDRLDDVRALGFDEHFIRMWTFYLGYCEGAFRERHTGDVQAVLTKPGARIPA